MRKAPKRGHVGVSLCQTIRVLGHARVSPGPGCIP